MSAFKRADKSTASREVLVPRPRLGFDIGNLSFGRDTGESVEQATSQGVATLLVCP